MRILGISGTPRKNGNSECLLNAALEPFAEAGWEIRKILLSEKSAGTKHKRRRSDKCAGRNQ